MATAVVLSEHEGARPATSAVPSHRSRRVGTRRSFLAVVSGLVAFIALQLGLAVAVEIRLPELRDAVYVRRLRRVQNAVRAKPVKPWTVIMVGTSRTLMGFRPGSTEKSWEGPAGRPVAAFNFGIAGGGPLSELLMWHRLQQDGVRPDLLMVEVMPVYLCSQTFLDEFCANHWPTSRLRQGDLALFTRYASTYRPHLRRDWLTMEAFPCYSQRLNLTTLLAPALTPQRALAGDAVDVDDVGAMKDIEEPTPERRQQLIPLRRDKYKPFLNGFRLGGPGCAALSELAASCRKEGVPIALVLMPEGPAFHSWYSPEALRDMREWVAQLGRDNNAAVIDARDWLPAENDFIDSIHFGLEASNRFTDRLGREYIVPMLRGQASDKEGP